MKIAICLSAYNGSSYLIEQLQSLENQSYDHSDIIIIARDDGSSDRSYEILQDFSKNTSLHIEIMTDRTNLGVKKSFEFLMNRALDMGSDYILFCDQDDVWDREKVSKTLAKMKYMERTYPDQSILIHSDLSVVDRELYLRHRSFWAYQNIDPAKDSINRLIFHNTVTGCAMMINRTLAEKVRVIPAEAIMHDWWIAMVASIFGHISTIDEPLILYRQHGKNDTGAKRYGWNYWLSKVLSAPSLDKYILQARVFLEAYRHELSHEHIEMLQAVSKLKEMNWFQRRSTLIKYRIFKNGLIRNIGLMVFA